MIFGKPIIQGDPGRFDVYIDSLLIFIELKTFEDIFFPFPAICSRMYCLVFLVNLPGGSIFGVVSQSVEFGYDEQSP